MNSYARSLLVSNPLRDGYIQAAIDELQFTQGSRGLDAGCGIGLQALPLAEAVGPGGHVTGVDISSELLDEARTIVEKAGLSERIAFKEGDVNRLPFDDDTFDWAWSADCVGYGTFDPLPPLKQMTRVVKTGGTVAILAWTSQQLLPGYPRLEARLNATSAGIAPFTTGMKPERHPLRAPGFMREAGLDDVKARTFVGEAQAPLSDEMRQALTALIDMRWPGVKSELSPEDWALFQRLCLPESPDFILKLPDYYAFFTETMFYGRVVK